MNECAKRVADSGRGVGRKTSPFDEYYWEDEMGDMRFHRNPFDDADPRYLHRLTDKQPLLTTK